MTAALSVAAALVNTAHRQLAYAERLLFAALEERATMPGRQPGQCGTRAGYRAHGRRGEPPCGACVTGNAWADRRTKAHRVVAETGTRSSANDTA